MIDVKGIVSEIKDNLRMRLNLVGFRIISDYYFVVIQIGDDPASTSYIRGKVKDANELGIKLRHFHFSEDMTEDELEFKVAEFRRDEGCAGIILQLPLPLKTRGFDIYKLPELLRYRKYMDLDGFISDSPFMPCTPEGIFKVLEHENVPIEGKNCLVIGRSNIVGTPTAQEFLRRNGTLMVAHSRTPKEELKKLTSIADIIVVAAGVPNLVTPDMVRKDTTIIDVGINRDSEGKLCGDCSREFYDDDEWKITPVPGGMGLMTRVMLMEHMVQNLEFMGKLNEDLVLIDTIGVIERDRPFVEGL